MWRIYNPNPYGARVGDCTVRAISKLLNQTWEKTYCDLCVYGLIRCDMPSANRVWGMYLKDKGYKRKHLPENENYTVAEFAHDHQNGKYLLAISGHVVTVENGDFFDTWDSGSEIPLYYWEEE